MRLEESDILLGIIPGPLFTDRCGHGGYVASFEVAEYAIEHLTNPQIAYQFDLYIWDENRACIRFGEGDSEYYSPVNIINVFLHGHMDRMYARATDIIRSKGKVVWVKNEKSTETPDGSE